MKARVAGILLEGRVLGMRLGSGRANCFWTCGPLEKVWSGFYRAKEVFKQWQKMIQCVW